MTTKFKFEGLIIWQNAMNLADDIYKVMREFPNEDRYNLSSQIMRAVDSIALNIAEGSILQSAAENKRFLGYAIRSKAETATCLHKAKRREYNDSDTFERLYSQCFNLTNMSIGLRNKIK
jgi:four helix bundle protein